jgi:hypothetical protein
MSYNTALETYNQANERFNASVQYFNNNFRRGLWFHKKDYNGGVFTQRYIYNETDFNNAN